MIRLRSANTASTDAPKPKEPVPDLSLRAPRPSVMRLRKSMVHLVVLGGAVLISGSLAWAFVVQPELRAKAQGRLADGRSTDARGPIRAAEVITRQPSSYDRLPEPRLPERDAAPSLEAAPVSGARDPDWRPPPPRSAEMSAADQAVRSGLFFEAQGAGRSPPDVQAAAPLRGEGTATSQGVESGYSRHVLTAPLSPFELKAGAVVPAVLLNGVDTTRAGPIVAAVTQNVFDTVSGRHLLIPQGARLIGRHEGESAYGDRRAFLIWDRLILPNGKSLILEGEPGVDAQGVVGVRGQVDRRLLPLLAGTLLAGAVTTLGQMAREDDNRRDGGRRSGGWLGDAGDAAAIEAAQVGGRLLDRELTVRPSIHLRQGASVRVLITRDLILEPYQP
ncbi:TrbI/VirB10 family protein [Brevundimonas diminuta]|nr:TrbI/VirB10 family protein [Brevundimonas diminuta]